MPSKRARAAISVGLLIQDGRSSGLTAPNGPSQAALLQSAIQKASVLPRDIAAVSIHGTGTPLGDPIEVGALGQGLTGNELTISIMLGQSYFPTA